MTTFERATHGVRSLDVAGMARPLYALGAGALVFTISLLLAATMAIAVLSGAAVASIAWLVGSLIH